MRIVIDMGHTPTSPGASGHIDELYCDREAGKRIIAELERRGHTVYNSTAPDWMAYPDEVNHRCQYTNSLSGIDLFVSLHLNAGGGHGTEVLYYYLDGDGAWYAQLISRNVANALKLPDRGAKPNDWVGVICNTNPTAVLIEFCFVDNWDDCEAWWRAPWDDVVNAVCDGIEGKEWAAGERESEPEPAPAPTPEPAPKPADNVRYCASTDPSGNEWLPEMIGRTDTSGSSDFFAGIVGKPIRWLAIDGVGKYRVCTQENGWLPWVDKYDPTDLEYGCAGDGSPIIAIEIPNSNVRYAAHGISGEWYTDMIGNHDTDGSSDYFAGAFTPIDAATIQWN